MFLFWLFTLAVQEPLNDDLRVDYVERVTLVRLPLEVTRDGNPYTRLRDRDLTVMENGEKVIIQKLEQVDTPLVIHFLFDLSTSNERHILHAKRAVKGIVDRMQPGDRAKISIFSTVYQPLTDYTSDGELLRRKLNLLTPVGSTALYDGIYAVVEDLAGERGNRVLILLSDGHDFLSRTGESELMSRMKYFKIPLVFAAFPTRRGDAPLLAAQYNFMRSLAKQSGGGTLKSGPGLDRDLSRYLRDRRKRYLVSFLPPEPEDAERWRSLVVRVDRCPDCRLAYRRGYQLAE
jgi:VWFA-related protein